MHLDAGDSLERFGDQMRGGADAGEAERHLAGFCLAFVMNSGTEL
jgi:hypothetical protein